MYIYESSYNGYCTGSELTRIYRIASAVKYSHYMQNLEAPYDGCYIVASTEVMVLPTSVSILAFDCDSRENLELLLNAYNDRCHIIESSPGRYWVITERIGPHWDIRRMMVRYRYFGIDEDHLAITWSRGVICFRMNPKNHLHIPKFPPLNNIKSGIVRSWMEEFKGYWESDYAKKLYYLQRALVAYHCDKMDLITHDLSNDF